MIHHTRNLRRWHVTYMSFSKMQASLNILIISDKYSQSGIVSRHQSRECLATSSATTTVSQDEVQNCPVPLHHTWCMVQFSAFILGKM